MRDIIRKIVIEAVAGTKDLTKAIDEIEALTKTDHSCCKNPKGDVVPMCEDCLYKIAYEGL